MTKKELEQQLNLLLKENRSMQYLILKLRNFIDSHFAFFRSEMVDMQNDWNKGVLATLNAMAKLYNKHTNFQKIETLNLNPELRVIRFPSKEEKNYENKN